MSRLGLGAFLVLRWSGHEVNHTTLPSAKVKNKWSHTSTPPCTPFMAQTEKTVLFFHVMVTSMKQYEGVDLAKVAQDEVQKQPFVNMVIKKVKVK